MGGDSVEDVLLPEFAQSVFFQPSFQGLRFEPTENRSTRFSVNNNYFLRFEMIQQWGGLRGNNQLCPRGGFSEEAG
jgi:hypothetical protein